MLTDIFSNRYEGATIWKEFAQRERKLLVQAFRIISEQLMPLKISDTIHLANQRKWTAIEEKLSWELGMQELSPKAWGGYLQNTWVSGTNTIDKVCKNFVLAEYKGNPPADQFMKDRISFVELAFREKEEEVKEANRLYHHGLTVINAFAEKTGTPFQGFIKDGREEKSKSTNESMNKIFTGSVEELNVRFRQASCGLHYHNGFIQQSADVLLQRQVEEPFWALLSDEVWKNVDIDMKEAFDKRDNGDRDPAFYAAKALESTIKIISKEKGLNTGKEGGAANFIDNLLRGKLIEVWEMQNLKNFFSKVRNPMGHGPGDAEMPELSPQQTDWAIEFCMSWTKSLIKRR